MCFVQTSKVEDIDCDFQYVDGYLFPHDESSNSYKLLDDELKTCHSIGVSVQKVNLGEQAPCRCKGGLAFSCQ